jgi:hypothetical protein
VAQGLSFRVDKRVEIVSPKDRAEVSLPVTLAWTVRDFNLKGAAPDGGSFAVFVDRAPVPPGEQLAWVARDDSSCEQPGCPNAAYLAKLGVFETTDTSLVITEIPGARNRSNGKRDRHRAVIVLLDAQGARIGEIAYDVTFDLKRKG